MSNIQRIYTAHTINIVALSVLGVYVPIYLLTLGYTLSQVILYYVIAHGAGLLFGLFLIVPLMQKWGVIKTFKLYYPLQILQLVLLHLLNQYPIPLEVTAIAYAAANYAYWMPLNILFIRHSEMEDMSGNLSKLFALPKLFGILGPLIGALLIPIFGFWPVFVLTAFGIICSFIPLASVSGTEPVPKINLSKAWRKFSDNKSLFIFEMFDNVIEESEWFWSIYVYLLIGNLATPGLVGSLEALGGALFTLLVGKFAKHQGKKLIPLGALLLLFITFLKLFVSTPIQAYSITLASSFALTFFLVSYFTTILKTIKHNDEEEFVILREIPTVLGRMVVFGTIYLTITNLRFFFIIPIVFIVFLLGLFYWKSRLLRS